MVIYYIKYPMSYQCGNGLYIPTIYRDDFYISYLWVSNISNVGMVNIYTNYQHGDDWGMVGLWQWQWPTFS